MIKFHQYYIDNGKVKARISYGLDNRIDGKKCVTLYAKNWGNDLCNHFPNDYKNDTDSMTDYFDKGRVNLFEDHPLYKIAREKAENFIKKIQERRQGNV